MKARSFTLTILAVASTLAVAAFDVQPAMAQGARFQFEPNKWQIREPVKSNYLNQQPPATRVGHGSMPKASSFLGVDPSFLKPVPKPQPVQPTVATNVRPSVSFGQPNIIPKQQPQALKPTQFNSQFGNPNQPPVVAHQQPDFGVPQSVQAPSTSKGVSARLAPPRHVVARKAVGGRLIAPKRPQALAATPKIQSYNSGYSVGSTRPTSSGAHSSSNVYGQVLNHR